MKPATAALPKVGLNIHHLHQALKKIAEKNITVIVGTDHGSVRVKTPAKVIGDKQTTANLRYKHGRNLNYEAKRCAGLPGPKTGRLAGSECKFIFHFCKRRYLFLLSQ